MAGKRGTNSEHGEAAQLVDAGAGTKARDARQVLIERAHAIPEAGFRAANAGVPATDRPVRATVPSNVRTVLEGDGPFAPHLVETVAGAMTGIAPLLDVLTG